MKHLITICVTALVAAFALAEPPAVLNNLDFPAGSTQHWKFRSEGAEIQPLGPADTAGFRVVVREASTQPWKTRLEQRTIGRLYAGERIVLKVTARSADKLPLLFGMQQVPYAPIVGRRVTLSDQWETYQAKGRISADITPDKALATLTFGFGKGRYEVRGLTVELPDRDARGELKPEVFESAHDLPAVDVAKVGGPALAAAIGDHRADMAAPLQKVQPRRGDTLAVEAIDVTGQPFSSARRLVTLSPVDWSYKAQFVWPVYGEVEEGDVLVAVFSYRAVAANPESGYANLLVRMEENSGRYRRFASYSINAPVDGQWHRVVHAFKADATFVPDNAGLKFRVGFGEQTIDVGGVHMFNLGKDASLASIPVTPMTYGGAAPDAPWRAAAAERIEAHRKADAVVCVVDAAGRPVGGAQVDAALTNHAFKLGVALTFKAMPGAPGRMDAADREPYFQHARELFNAGTMENALKWKWVDHPEIVEPGAAGVKWMLDQDWFVRGHTLIWPSWRRSPDGLSKLADDPAALRKAAADHIRDYAARFRGQMDAWDVVNEPYMHNDLLKVLGRDVIADWFRIAHEADPTAELFLNDNGLISEPHATTQLRHQYYLKLIDDLKAAGVPIDGMGFQGHFSGALTPIRQVFNVWDAFAARGLTLHVTEFDMDTDDDDLQARYLRDLLTAAFSHPSVELFQLWHYWEGRSFHGAKGIYRKDWTPKPAAKVLDELMHRTWTTHATGRTGDDGRFGFRGFKGEYSITVTHGGRKQTVTASVADDAGPIVIEWAE